MVFSISSAITLTGLPCGLRAILCSVEGVVCQEQRANLSMQMLGYHNPRHAPHASGARSSFALVPKNEWLILNTIYKGAPH